MSPSLAHILNTRPSGQHLAFTQRLEAHGFSVSHLPCLVITGLPGRQLKKHTAEPFDIVLFTSVNAVRFAHARQPFPWADVSVHAIGAATATALQTLQQPVALQPLAPFSSEAYLAQLAAMPPARLLLIKGEGGRGLITHQLQIMGWHVTNLDIYRRELPDIDTTTVARILRQSPPDIVSLTSNESLDNLVTLADDCLPELLKKPLVVNSQRAVEQARQLGFERTPLVAHPPGDQGQINAIKQWIEVL